MFLSTLSLHAAGVCFVERCTQSGCNPCAAADARDIAGSVSRMQLAHASNCASVEANHDKPQVEPRGTVVVSRLACVRP